MNINHTFEALDLSPSILRTLASRNYTTPSPIQAMAIPPILEGKDLLASAQTGTGKTAAFALPLMTLIEEQPIRVSSRCMNTLVLTPTRELAVQVAKSFRTYGQNIDFSCAEIYGGVSMQPQIKALRKGLDVLVATPGRLLDLRNQRHVDFSEVDCLVLDEADRMLDMVFIYDIRKIIKELPQERQTIFLSATLSPQINKLAKDLLNDPVEIRIQPEKPTAEKVDHRMCFLNSDNKLPMLESLIREQEAKAGFNLTMVFSRTKHGSDKLVKKLQGAGIRAEAIHGNKSQNARQRSLENFRSGKAPVLVATDVAARGIDVKDVTLVINYDLPDEAESYVHRIGRTARAGSEGVALSLCTRQDLGEMKAIERLLKAEIPVFEEHPFHDASIAAVRAQNHKQKKYRPQKNQRSQRKRPAKRFQNKRAPANAR